MDDREISQLATIESLSQVTPTLYMNLLHARREYPNILASFMTFSFQMNEGLGVQPWSPQTEVATPHPVDTSIMSFALMLGTHRTARPKGNRWIQIIWVNILQSRLNTCLRMNFRAVTRKITAAT